MRNMTGCAALAHGIVLIDARPRLFTMTARARLVQTRHREAGSRRLHDIRAMRIVALHAAQFPFQHRMTLWQPEFGVRLEMTGEARRGFLAGIDDEPPAPATACDVFAARPVTRLTASLAFHCRIAHMHARMSAGWKAAGVIGMAFVTSLVPDKHRTLDQWRFDDRALNRRAGTYDECEGRSNSQRTGDQPLPPLHDCDGWIRPRMAQHTFSQDLERKYMPRTSQHLPARFKAIPRALRVNTQRAEVVPGISSIDFFHLEKLQLELRGFPRSRCRGRSEPTVQNHLDV